MVEYLIGVGAAKAGTTLLYDLLIKNEVFSKGRRKELHYFDKVKNPSLEDYQARRTKRKGEILLDITPAYMFYDGAIERLSKTIDTDKARFIILLRDPIERAVSYYCMSRRRGFETLSFKEAFAREAERMKSGEIGYRHNSYFSHSLYMWQLDNVFKYIPRENARIWIFEDFVKNQQLYADKVMDLVERPRFNVESSRSNSGYDVKNPYIAMAVRVVWDAMPGRLHSGFRHVSHAVEKFNAKPIDSEKIAPPELRSELVKYFADDVRGIAEKYSLDCSSWKNFRGIL